MSVGKREHWVGTLRCVEVGLGAWLLECDDGERVPLYGEVPAGLRDQRVRVTGTRDVEVGIGMVGDGLGVSVEAVEGC